MAQIKFLNQQIAFPKFTSLSPFTIFLSLMLQLDYQQIRNLKNRFRKYPTMTCNFDFFQICESCNWIWIFTFCLQKLFEDIIFFVWFFCLFLRYCFFIISFSEEIYCLRVRQYLNHQNFQILARFIDFDFNREYFHFVIIEIIDLNFDFIIIDCCLNLFDVHPWLLLKVYLNQNSASLVTH